jgi:hypothetical protein
LSAFQKKSKQEMHAQVYNGWHAIWMKLFFD